MSNILIKGAHVLLEDYTIKVADIAVQGTEILAIGNIPADFTPERTVDGKDHFAVPGLINGHTHASMTLLRSYGDDMELMDWLNNRIWPTEAKMVEKDIRVGGELGVVVILPAEHYRIADKHRVGEPRFGLRFGHTEKIKRHGVEPEHLAVRKGGLRSGAGRRFDGRFGGSLGGDLRRFGS